jgi:hypothetical protein
MYGLLDVYVRIFCIAFGVIAIAYGFKGLTRSKADSYDSRSFKTNLWGAFGAIILGLLLILGGIGWLHIFFPWFF